MKIGMIGTGYVGLVSGTCLAEIGNTVVCMDTSAAKIAVLRAGRLPLYEPGLEELVHRNVRDGRLSFTTDIRQAVEGIDICFIAVGTPPDEDGSADRRHVLAAAGAIGEVMNGPLVVVVKSTVPVGTCSAVAEELSKAVARRGLEVDFDVCSNPEFLKEGKAVDDFMRPDRVVVGSSSRAARELLERLYAPLLDGDRSLVHMSVRSAEMTKYAANVMLATRISLVNEIALICDRVGADVMDVRRGIGTDRRIGMGFLDAGIGYGGSCFPKDVQALAHVAIESGSTSSILDAVDHVNVVQKMLLANRIIEHYDGNVRGRHFAMWGLAFKPETDDIREAPALTIIKRLTDAGATVTVYDPAAMPNGRERLARNPSVTYAEDMYGALAGADALALVTEWPCFRTPDFARVKAALTQPVIFDGRNQFAPHEMRELGFTYRCVGRLAA